MDKIQFNIQGQNHIIGSKLFPVSSKSKIQIFNSEVTEELDKKDPKIIQFSKLVDQCKFEMRKRGEKIMRTVDRNKDLRQRALKDLLSISKDDAKPDDYMSTEKSLEDIIPINWSEDVLSGKKKVLIGNEKN